MFFLSEKYVRNSNCFFMGEGGQPIFRINQKRVKSWYLRHALRVRSVEDISSSAEFTRRAGKHFRPTRPNKFTRGIG